MTNKIPLPFWQMMRIHLDPQDDDDVICVSRTSTVWSNLTVSVVLLCQVTNSRLLATAALRQQNLAINYCNQTI